MSVEHDIFQQIAFDDVISAFVTAKVQRFLVWYEHHLIQGRPLAGWTDCFQSAPELRQQIYTFQSKVFV